MSRQQATNRKIIYDGGTSLSFGGNSAVNIVNSSGQIYNNTDFSLSMRFKKKGETGAVQYLFSHPSTATGNRIYVDFTNNSNILRATLGNTARSSTKAFKINEWNHAVILFRRADYNVRILLNNEEVLGWTAVAQPGVGLASTVIVGAQSVLGGLGFKGLMDDVGSFQRIITDTEISNLYYNNIVPTDGLVLQLPFNEGSGTTALDTSGNGNNGTISGATYSTDVPSKLKEAATARILATAREAV